MGGGKAQWWVVNATEGREQRFVELLLRQAGKNGVTADLSEAPTDEEAGGKLPAEGELIGAADGPIQGWWPQKVMQVG
jgi:hypothetical protein